ncbi:MAG: protease inhibitor I42 family protein [Patescibacteria group bacterium]
MNKLSLWLLPIVFLGGCALVQQPLPQLTLKDHQTNIDYPVGQKFQIVLPSNGTTGFKWELDNMTVGVLEKLSDEYKITDEYAENVVGAGGEEIWTFQVVQEERSHIVMKYRKPWDKIEVANEFLVTINGNPGDDGLLTYLGKIEGNAAGAQFDDCFIAQDGDKFGITPITQNQIGDPGIKAKIAEFTDQDILIEIRGSLTEPAIDCNGKQFIVHEIQAK